MKLTPHEAYQAMINYLELYFNRTKSDDVGSILGDLTSGLDPAVRRDWEESINKIFYTTNSNVQYIKHQHHSFRLFNNSDVILFYKEEILEKQ